MPGHTSRTVIALGCVTPEEKISLFPEVAALTNLLPTPRVGIRDHVSECEIDPFTNGLLCFWNTMTPQRLRRAAHDDEIAMMQIKFQFDRMIINSS